MEWDLALGPEFSLERLGGGPITDWDLGFIASRAAARALSLPEAWLLSLKRQRSLEMSQ